jgi:hypothetical protein
MYILVATESGGVYASRDQNRKKVVQIFVEEDDATRYLGMLDAEGFQEDLEVTEVDITVVVANCKKYGYNYCIVEPNQLVIPPS